MRTLEVQYITREMLARLTRPESLLWDAIVDGQWERRAARLLVISFVLLVSCVGALLWVMH